MPTLVIARTTVREDAAIHHDEVKKYKDNKNKNKNKNKKKKNKNKKKKKNNNEKKNKKKLKGKKETKKDYSKILNKKKLLHLNTIGSNKDDNKVLWCVYIFFVIYILVIVPPIYIL